MKARPAAFYERCLAAASPRLLDSCHPPFFSYSLLSPRAPQRGRRRSTRCSSGSFSHKRPFPRSVVSPLPPVSPPPSSLWPQSMLYSLETSPSPFCHGLFIRPIKIRSFPPHRVTPPLRNTADLCDGSGVRRRIKGPAQSVIVPLRLKAPISQES